MMPFIRSFKKMQVFEVMRPLSSQSGIGLIELLVSMLIGLFVMAGVIQMFATTTQNAVAASGSSRIQENIRYAFARMREDISQSGNLGCYNTPFINKNLIDLDEDGDGSVKNMLGFNAGSGEFFDFTTFIFGSESSTASTFPAGNVTTGTDTISVRYVSHLSRFDITETVSSGSNQLTVDATHTDYPTLDQFQIVVASNCNITNIFMITNDPETSGGVLEFKPNVISTGLNNGQFNKAGGFKDKYIHNRIGGRDISAIPYLYAGRTGAYQYFIGDSSSATGTCHTTDRPENCSLYRRANAFNQELVKGVHDMQVEYGWTNDAGDLTFADATTVAAQDAWLLVDRVNVSLSFNSIDNVVSKGNKVSDLLQREISQTFNLPNQL